MLKQIQIEKELKEFDFLAVHNYTSTSIYTLVEEAKDAMYFVRDKYEHSDDRLPVIYMHGRYQVIVTLEGEVKKYKLQYVI